MLRKRTLLLYNALYPSRNYVYKALLLEHALQKFSQIIKLYTSSWPLLAKNWLCLAVLFLCCRNWWKNKYWSSFALIQNALKLSLQNENFSRNRKNQKKKNRTQPKIILNVSIKNFFAPLSCHYTSAYKLYFGALCQSPTSRLSCAHQTSNSSTFCHYEQSSFK